MDLIIDFLAESRMSNDEKEAYRVRRVAARYWLSADRKLYQRSFGGAVSSLLAPRQSQ